MRPELLHTVVWATYIPLAAGKPLECWGTAVLILHKGLAYLCKPLASLLSLFSKTLCMLRFNMVAPTRFVINF